MTATPLVTGRQRTRARILMRELERRRTMTDPPAYAEELVEYGVGLLRPEAYPARVRYATRLALVALTGRNVRRPTRRPAP